MAGTSSLQYPNRLARRNRESRCARSAAEHIPDHAGAAYWSLETTVARNTSCGARSTSMANSKLELDDSKEVTWSAAVSLSLTTTPKIRRLIMRSMSSRGGRRTVFGLAANTCSLVLTRFSVKLLSAAHESRCRILPPR